MLKVPEKAQGIVKIKVDRKNLEQLYENLNRREYVHPDPLEVLYKYSRAADVEVAGLIASSLAYGRVCQILVSVGAVLEKLGRHPAFKLEETEPAKIKRMFAGFRHRFTGGEELANLLIAARRVRIEYGSLNKCFVAGLTEEGGVTPALSWFAKELSRASEQPLGYLVPNPADGSACKRLNLYLRWMARKDAVDTGAWKGVKASQLLVPMDTHMHRIATELGLLQRKNSDFKAVRELTDSFAKINPDDPVKYDFALTRLGIRNDMHLEDFTSTCRKAM